MGSSSKKHKGEKTRESRKRKHRSRSRSPSGREVREVFERERGDRERVERDREREKHRHGKKHHKDRKREKHSPTSRERTSEHVGRQAKQEESESEDGGISAPPPPKISRAISPPSPTVVSTSDNSMSITETNRLRAKLGLKPLQAEAGADVGDGPVKSAAELMGGKDMGEFVHKPAENLSAKRKEEKLRQRLAERKERRAIDARLKKVKTLGEDSDEEDNALAWVEKSRLLQMEKDKAEKRAKMLEELDAEFGVGELVNDEFRHDAGLAYSTKDLQGLTVEHNMENFKEGRAVVLTLKDKGVLDEDDDDVLINVNIVDDEKYKKNIDRKKQKPFLHGYNAYDEEKVDEFGNVQKSLLGKYDEEIAGEQKSSFVIGKANDIERQRQKTLMSVKDKLQKKTLESLNMPALQLASEYYTQEEMVQFKKPKKKVRKIRKKVLRASDLESLPTNEPTQKDLGSRSRNKPKMDSSGFRPVDPNAPPEEPEHIDARGEEPKIADLDDPMVIDDVQHYTEDLSDIRLDPDEGEVELQLALNKARKLKQKKDLEANNGVDNVAAAILSIKREEEEEDRDAARGSIWLNATAEFCRTLGDIPTYGLAGNRDEDAEELMDFEREMTEERKRQEEERNQRGAWNEVEVEEVAAEILPPEAPILDEEPDVGMGVAGALRLAVSKGYLEKEDNNRPSASRMHHLQAQNYSIEDKTYVDDDKFGRRERYAGPTTDFKEKDNFKPNVKLDYIDDDGRVLNSKEAFRYLSHKFHGKGPGKNKVEKRMKKVEQEVLMKQMSSTDTPLGTLNMLQQKQKETHSAYVVLSGSKQLQSISKTKM